MYLLEEECFSKEVEYNWKQGYGVRRIILIIITAEYEFSNNISLSMSI